MTFCMDYNIFCCLTFLFWYKNIFTIFYTVFSQSTNDDAFEVSLRSPFWSSFRSEAKKSYHYKTSVISQRSGEISPFWKQKISYFALLRSKWRCFWSVVSPLFDRHFAAKRRNLTIIKITSFRSVAEKSYRSGSKRFFITFQLPKTSYPLNDHHNKINS